MVFLYFKARICTFSILFFIWMRFLFVGIAFYVFAKIQNKVSKVPWLHIVSWLPREGLLPYFKSLSDEGLRCFHLSVDSSLFVQPSSIRDCWNLRWAGSTHCPELGKGCFRRLPWSLCQLFVVCTRERRQHCALLWSLSTEWRRTGGQKRKGKCI